MCKIHTNSKVASINQESNLNEYIQYLVNSQTLYWNLIGQNKSIQPKFWPTSNTTSEWSKVGHKDLIVTSLLKAGGRLHIEGRKTANENHTDQKSVAFCRTNLYMLYLLAIYLCIWKTSHFNQASAYCQEFPRKNHSWSQDGTHDRPIPNKH